MAVDTEILRVSEGALVGSDVEAVGGEDGQDLTQI